MKAFFLRCAVCGSLDAQRLFPSFFLGELSQMQAIVICRRCGLVYRNPHIPEQCTNVYEKVDSWTPNESEHVERLRNVAAEITKRVAMQSGDYFLDVGCGPGWLARVLCARFPNVGAVLLEPSLEVAAHAKRTNPLANVLPGVLEEADLPEGSFSLITACGVDYLFRDHRADIERIVRLLRDGGTFYVERNVFVDTEAVTGHALLDMEETFGLNGMMNTWFGRAQFGEYLAEFFDVFDTIEYTTGVSPAPYFRPNTLLGFFCRKRRGGERRPPGDVPNRYAEHLQILRERAVRTSLDDLRALAEAGVRRALVCGCGTEARRLAELIRENQLFGITGFVGTGADAVLRDTLSAEFALNDGSPPDVILVASLEHQEEYVAQLEAAGHVNVLPCFRRGITLFWSENNTRIQMKAFVPALRRAYRERMAQEPALHG